MSDLRVVAQLSAKPGSETVVREALSKLVAATREEDGCNDYQLYESQDAPGTFITIESWASKAAMDAHLQTPHVAQVFATAGEHLGDIGIHQLSPVDV